MIVVDDGSVDDTAAIAEAAGATVIRQPNRGKGAAIRRGDRRGRRRHRRDPGRRHGVRPGRGARADRADRPRRRRRRLRLAPARRQAAARVPLLAPGRQPLPLAGHERPLQHDALGHGDRLQGVPDGRAPLARPDARTASGSSRRSPGKVCKRKLRIYELPDLLLRPDARGGQEDHLARRIPRALGARPRPGAAIDRRDVDRASSCRRTTRRR